ncbi:MAG: hemerythrin domain-containing protein [Proteobacteria bacterium]|nr:hemerythrin domain-containing protein [Pseudomonadota bacterium]
MADDTATPQDAIALLKADHRAVEGLFGEFEGLSDPTDKMGVADRICLALRVHTQIEEEIFYPALRGHIEEKEIDEAVVEHRSAKALISEIEAAGGADAMFDARVQVLKEQIESHVKEEETELFPAAKRAGLDLKDLGAKLAERKATLLRDYRSDLSDLRAAAEHPSFRPESAGGMQPGETGGEAARTASADGSKTSGLQPDQDTPGGAGAGPKESDQVKGRSAAPG